MNIEKKVIIVTDDTVGAAALASLFSKRGNYFIILEAPRMQRPDASNEVIRLANILRRISPETTILYKLEESIADQLWGLSKEVVEINDLQGLEIFGVNYDEWKDVNDREAIRKLISVSDATDLSRAILYASGADVGCAIAAAYAIAHGVKMFIVQTDDDFLDWAVDKLNAIDATSAEIRKIEIAHLTEEIEKYLPPELKEKAYEQILVMTEGIPFSLALSPKEVIYVNTLMMGYHLAHNIYEYMWGQKERIAPIGLFIEDRSVSVEQEFKGFSQALSRANGLVKRKTTRHPKLTELEIMTLPYDVLYIATHAKQLEGYENTYRIKFSDEREHEIKVKEAKGIVGVVFYLSSVDGVMRDSLDWTDSHNDIWGEFLRNYAMKAAQLPDPIASQAATLRMRSLVLGDEPGQNSPFSVQRLASGQRAIIIANACGSWTEMSTRFTFAGVSAYIGTLWAVRSSTANEFAHNFMAKLFQIPLHQAFFEARAALRDPIDQLNYVLTCGFENKYDSSVKFSKDGYREVLERLSRNLYKTRENLKRLNEDAPADLRNNMEIDEMLYENEIKSLTQDEE